MFKKFLALVVTLCATIAFAAVDVNKATEAELDGIKGVGPSTTKMIMNERKKGEFKSWEDFIDRMKGVGEARAVKLSAEGMTVSGASFKPTGATSDNKPANRFPKKEDKKDAKSEAKSEVAKK